MYDDGNLIRINSESRESSIKIINEMIIPKKIVIAACVAVCFSDRVHGTGQRAAFLNDDFKWRNFWWSLSVSYGILYGNLSNATR